MAYSTQTDLAQTRFKRFIKLRHAVYLAKQEGVTLQPGHATYDPIIAKYRFCNVYRKLDRVTIWLDENWYTGWEDERDLWFMAVVARLINEPGALAALGSVLPWKPTAFAAKLLQRQQDGEKIRNTAYIVSTNGRAMPFVPYIVQHVLEPIWKAPRHTTRPQAGTTLAQYAQTMEKHMGLGSFLVGQVIADLKYYDEHLINAEDVTTFVVPGPGSKRGMNRLLGLPFDQPMPTGTFMHGMSLANKLANDVTFDNDWPHLDAQDVQNCLCEFDKWERAFNGDGKPKQLYKPWAGPEL